MICNFCDFLLMHFSKQEKSVRRQMLTKSPHIHCWCSSASNLSVCCETLLTELRNIWRLVHCHPSTPDVCYEMQQSLLLCISQPQSLRTKPQKTYGWHYLPWRTIWEWETKRKNDGECRRKEIKGGERGKRSSPQHPSTKYHSKDPNLLL